MKPRILSIILVATAAAAPAHAAERGFAVHRFTAIETHGSDDIRIVPGTGFAVSATGERAVLDALRIDVRGDTLHIERKGGSYRDDGAVVTVRAPVVRSVEMHGSGDLSAAGIAQDRFTLSLHGSSDVDIGGLRVGRAKFELDGSGDIHLGHAVSDALAVDVNGSGSVTIDDAAIGHLAYAVHGSGDFRIRGAARTATLGVAGSGGVDADALDTDTLTVDMSGSADVRAHATGAATIDAAGSGSVRVTGGPRCSVSTGGSVSVDCN